MGCRVVQRNRCTIIGGHFRRYLITNLQRSSAQQPFVDKVLTLLLSIDDLEQRLIDGALVDFENPFVASLASDEFNPKETLILSIVLSVFSYGAFIKLLNLQFPVWPAFLGL